MRQIPWLNEVPRRELILVGAAMSASMLVVLAYIAFRHGDPLLGDQIEYDLEGRFFADGQLWWTTTPFGIAHPGAWKAPGYPLWVGFWYAIVGESPTRVELVQALLAPVTVGLTWLLARRLFGPRVAIASAAVTAVLPLVWEWIGLLYAEALAIPLTMFAILLFLGRSDVDSRRALVVGGTIGALILVRPTSAFLYAGVLAAFIVAVGTRKGLGLTALSLFISVMVVLPWTIRNYIEFDALLPISVQDGAIAGTFNETSANDPRSPYAWRPIAPSFRDLLAPRNAVDDAELVSRLRARAFDYIEEHPFSVAEAFFWNGLSRYWDVRRPARAMDEVPFQGRSRPIAAVGLALHYALLPLAIFGLWRARSRREILFPVLSLAIAASIVFTVASGTRYRAPIEPLIVILACSAVLPAARKPAEPIPAEA